MTLKTLLFVGASTESVACPDPWRSALLIPLGGSPAVLQFARGLDRRAGRVEFILPVDLADQLLAMGVDAAIHTCVRELPGGVLNDESLFRPISEVLILNAARMPRIDVPAAIEAHRSAGTDMTVFYDLQQQTYCSEQITTDDSGAVCRASRLYSDSSSTQLQRTPLAVVLSRHAIRPGWTAVASGFQCVVDHLTEEVRRVGKRFKWLRDAAVSGHATALDAVLCVIERLHPPSEVQCRPGVPACTEPGLCVQGPVELGKRVQIGEDAVIIGPAALGDGAVVGRSAVVCRSVVLPGEIVPAHSHCHNRLVGGPQVLNIDVGSASIDGDSEPDEPMFASRAGERLKRVVDVVASALGLVALSPVLLCIGITIKVTSHGPVLFRHRRQGRGGVEFDCLKFRTMIDQADALQAGLRANNQVDGPQFKITNDPRVTPIGRILRRTNLDELPQLVNVLLGQMSLVGPRPSPDRENQCCPPWRKARLSVRPGITGLWQVARSANRHLTDFQEWIFYDTSYVEHRCLKLDLQIIWQTVRILLHLGASRRWKKRWEPAPEHYETIAPVCRQHRNERADLVRTP